MKHIIIVSISVFLTISLNAQCVGVISNGECIGMDDGMNSSSGYQGDSGQMYQYDMSNGNDQLRYSTDVAAQQRDSMYQDYSGNRERDESMGQYGGGVYGY